MAAVTIHSDFGAQEEEICHYFHLIPFYLPWSNGARCHDLSFLIFSLKMALSPPPSPSSRGSLVPLHFLPLEWYHLHIRGCRGFFCLSWFQLVSSLAFLMRSSVYRVNKQGDSRQPCRTPFPILNQPVVSYRVLTIASLPTYRFLRRQIRWSGIPISLRAFHSLHGLHSQRL